MSNKTKSRQIADEFKHLSHNEIEELYIKYLAGEKNSVLIEYYKINIIPNKLIKLLPSKILYETLCPYCEIAMFTKRQSKSSSSLSTPPIECYECNHKIYSEYLKYRHKICECNSCVKLRIQQKLTEERKKRNEILEKFNIYNIKAKNYTELSLIDKIFLLTLLRRQTDENFKYISSLYDFLAIEPLSPTHIMDINLLTRLYKSNIIIIDHNSEIDAFIESEELNSFYIDKVRWIVNISLNGVNRSELNEIYQYIYNELKSGIQAEQEEEVLQIIFKIPCEEVLQYIHMRADELKVDFTAEKKTREVVNQLLQKFSVSEIYYFAKKSIENAHLYYSKGLTNGKKHAANTIPNKILSLGERALNENWNTYKYNRDSRVPRSYISKVFYDFFLQDEDAGFYKAPGKYWKQELLSKYFSKSNLVGVDSLYCNQCKSNVVTTEMTGSNLEVTCKSCGNITTFTPNE